MQLGELRLGGLCLGCRAPASGHRPVRSPREWRRQAGAARAAGADVSTHTAGECGGAQTVLTQRRCATARVSSGARGTRAQAPTPELGVQQIFFPRLRPRGQTRGLGLAALAGVVDDRAERRQRKAMPSPSAPTRRSSSLETRSSRGTVLAGPASHLQGVSQQQQQPIHCVRQAHITRSTPTGDWSQRTSWHAHSWYSHSTQSSVSGAP